MSVNVKKVVKIYLAIESCPEKIQEKIIIRRTFFLLLFVEKSFMKQFGVVSTTKCCFVLLKLSKEIQKLKKEFYQAVANLEPLVQSRERYLYGVKLVI